MAETDQTVSSPILDSKKPESTDSTPAYTFSRLSMIRDANAVEYVFLTVGFVLAVCLGPLLSWNSILFGELMNGMISGERQYENKTMDYEKFYIDTKGAVVNYFKFASAVFVSGFGAAAIFNTFSERQGNRISLSYFAALLRQDAEWYDMNIIGELKTQMSNGLEAIRNGLGEKLGFVIIFLTCSVCGVCISIYSSILLFLVVFTCTFISLIAIVPLKNLIENVSGKEGNAYGKAGGMSDQAIRGVKTVNALNGRQSEINRYSKVLSEAKKHGTCRVILTAIGSGFLPAVSFLSMAVCFWFGTKLVINGYITPATIFVAFWSGCGAAIYLSRAIPLFPILTDCYLSAISIFEVIDRKVPIDSMSEDGVILNNVKGIVKFENVSFKYPARQEVNVLNDVSLYVNPGENIGLVGHSGCGKSTLASLLMHFFKINKGRVSIDNINVEDLNLFYLRNIVGIVDQEPALFTDTIENNIRLGTPELDDAEVEYFCKLTNAHEFIINLSDGYKTVIGNGGLQLSGGQRQRLAIARTLARKPAVLILDEATSALDSENESLVQATLEQSKHGRATITIAHRLSTIRNCDRIYVFENGSIVEVGSHEELMMKDGYYSRMVQLQALETIQESTEEGETADTETCDLELSESETRHRHSISCSVTSEESAFLPQLQIEQEREKSSIADTARLLKPAWWMIVLGILACLLVGLSSPAYSVLYGEVFRTLSTGTDDEKIYSSQINAWLFIGLAFYVFVTTIISGLLIGGAGEKLTKKSRVNCFSNILSQGGDYFDQREHSYGRLTTRLNTDSSNIRAAIDQRLSDVIQSCFALICGFAIAFSYNWKVAPVGLITVTCLSIIQFILTLYLKKRGKIEKELTEEVNQMTFEAIEKHRTIQCLTREKYFIQKYDDMLKPIRRRRIISGLLQAFSFSLTVSFTYFHFAIGYFYGINLIRYQLASPFAVFQVIESLNSGSSFFIHLAVYMPELTKARISAASLLQMLRDKPKMEGDSEAGKKITLEGDITFEKVHFGYQVSGKKMVLKDFSLKIERGKTTAIVGSSGCGKTTIFQLLERFYDPISGEIRFDNDCLKELNLKNLRSQIALVSQQPTLFNYSIRENIAYGLDEVTNEDIIKAAKLANAHEFISNLPQGYETNVGECGSQLSGGQKQRIAIARALVRKPTILLLDEATSALDVESEKSIQRALAIVREGRTCVVIAHRLSTIIGADRIAVIKHGRVVEQGTHQQLMYLGGEYANFVHKSLS